MEKNTPRFIASLKGKRKISAITAYDYPSAYYADRAGVDVILVGDSLGMVIKGEENTLGVTLQDVEYHTRAVAKGVSRALVVGDLPFMSYFSVEEALKSSATLIRAGASAVKLEGPRIEQIRALIREGIPVMGHVGLTPQQYLHIGFKTQGRRTSSALKLVEQAKAIEDAGAFSVVLESVPMEVAREITSILNIPTIGIGAGPFCDGQILVFHDLLGMYPGEKPSFVREYAKIGEEIVRGIKGYIEDVVSGNFPSEDESFKMKPGERDSFIREVKKWK